MRRWDRGRSAIDVRFRRPPAALPVARTARRDACALEPRTGRRLLPARDGDARSALGIEVRIWTMPVEIPEPDPVRAGHGPRVLRSRPRPTLLAHPAGHGRRCFEAFRCGFIGKCSPVHFFWGSFDLAVTRFSGRRRRSVPEPTRITREAYSHEVISHGFWPGGGAVQEPAFYAYAAPAAGWVRSEQAATRRQRSTAGSFSEFILPYEAVRSAADPAEAAARLPDEHLRRSGGARRLGSRDPGTSDAAASVTLL